MRTYYGSFGQPHAHNFGGVVFNSNVLVRVEAEDVNKATEKMCSFFGEKWSCLYEETEVPRIIGYYPDGVSDFVIRDT